MLQSLNVYLGLDLQSEILEIASPEPNTNILFESTIQGTFDAARKLCKDYDTMQTLVTGSQHLVGGALILLQPSEIS
jgi:hypothetical protein